MTWTSNPDRTLIATLSGAVGGRVRVMGRVSAVRSHGTVNFVDVSDRSGKVQVVLGSGALPSVHAVVACVGLVVENHRAPGGVEMQEAAFDVLSAPVDNPPFDPDRLPSPNDERSPAIDTLLDHRPISIRGPAQQAVIKLVSELLHAADECFRALDFVEIKTPKLVSGGTEGGAGMFEVKYFERAAYLAQSPQLYKQTLAATPLERVFEVGPVFRAEKHATARHLNEFVGIDAEVAYLRGLDDLMSLEETLVRSVVQHLASKAQPLLTAVRAQLPKVDVAFPRIDLNTAKELATGSRPSRTRPAEDLTPEEERAVGEWALRECGSDAVFVYGFPARTRPFYTMPSPGGRKSESMDLLLRGLEISSGGLRIHDAQQLEDSMRRHDVEPDSMGDYLSVFRAGCPPHGGFGIGLERFAQRLLELPNVRHASLFPRDRTRLQP